MLSHVRQRQLCGLAASEIVGGQAQNKAHPHCRGVLRLCAECLLRLQPGDAGSDFGRRGKQFLRLRSRQLREQHTDRAPRREPGVTGLSGGGPPCRVQSRHGISLRRHCPAVVPRTTIEAEQFVAQYTHIETLERHIGHAIAASSTAVLCDAFTSFFATLSLR